MDKNKHSAGTFKKLDEKYFLTGKIYCGNCGATMSGISGTSRDNGIYRYYQCMKSKKRRCAKKIISKDLLEDIVLKAVMKIFSDKALVKRICNACFELQTKESFVLPALKKRLRENEKEFENIMSAIKKGVFTKSTKKELEKLEAEQEQLEQEIAKERIARPIIERDKIEAWIMRFAKTDLSDAVSKQGLIDAFVNSVYVYDDKVVVFLNYKDGESCVNLDDFDDIKKENTQLVECSSSVKFGDPYGN